MLCRWWYLIFAKPSKSNFLCFYHLEFSLQIILDRTEPKHISWQGPGIWAETKSSELAWLMFLYCPTYSLRKMWTPTKWFWMLMPWAGRNLKIFSQIRTTSLPVALLFTGRISFFPAQLTGSLDPRLDHLISDIFKNYKIYEESDQQENILRVYDCNYFQEQKEGDWMNLNEEHL